MSDVPMVSVVMGVYNDAAYVPASLDSVLSQQGVEFEVVVVDDGSTDDTAAVLQSYAARDPRVRVIRQPNAGLTRALMSGCEEARGEYIARLDAGDVFCPSRLQAQRDRLDRCGTLAFVSCWTEFCGPDWEHLYVQRGEATPEEGLSILPENPAGGLRTGPTSHPSVMFRRSAYRAAGGYRPEFYVGQDWDLWYRLAARGAFAIVAAILCRVRVLPRGITAVSRRRHRAIGRLSREAMRRRLCGQDEGPCLRRAAAIRPRLPSEASRRAAAGSLFFVGQCLRRNRDSRCRTYFQKAARAAPWHPRYGLALIADMLCPAAAQPPQKEQP